MAEASRQRLVAVVDDNQMNRMFIRMLLDRGFDGLSVVEGADGRDAIDLRFAEPPPDLMIVNGVMPGMHGPEAIAAIRRTEAERGLRRAAIAISSAGPWWLDAGVAAGADATLELPVNMAQLFSVVSHALGIEPLAELRPVARPHTGSRGERPRLPMPVPRFPMEIRVDAAQGDAGRRAGADEDGHRWLAVPTYGAASGALRETFNFDCPVYEARHAEVWEAEDGARRTCAHRSSVVESA